MKANPPILLLDTNVWLDLFLPGRPRYETVAALAREASSRDASLAYPSHALLDIYQKVRSDNKAWIRRVRPLTETDAVAIKRLAWDAINALQRQATAVPADTSDVYLACKYRDSHDDLEDDLVIAACLRAKANYLVTSDETLLRHSPIEAHTPTEMLELLRAGRAKGTAASREVAGSSDWFYRWLEQYA